MTPLYFIAYLSPPDYKRKKMRRFVGLEDALNFVTRKTGLEVKTSDILRYVWKFSDHTKVTGSQSSSFIAARIRDGSTSFGVKEFVVNKVLGIPKAPDSLVVEILQEEDLMRRDNLILSYKLAHLEMFPEIKKMIL